MSRQPYPSDVSNEEWHCIAPYLALIDEQAPQRLYALREVFNALRWLTQAGAPWRVAYQQFRGWSKAGCFEAVASDYPSQPRTCGAASQRKNLGEGDHIAGGVGLDRQYDRARAQALGRLHRDLGQSAGTVGAAGVSASAGPKNS